MIRQGVSWTIKRRAVMDTRNVDSIKRTSRGPECSYLSLLKLLDKGTEVFDLSSLKFRWRPFLSEVAKRG